LVHFFEEDLLRKHKTISPQDLEIFQVVDSVDEAYAYILKETKKIKSIRQI